MKGKLFVIHHTNSRRLLAHKANFYIEPKPQDISTLIFKSPILTRPHRNVDAMMVTPSNSKCKTLQCWKEERIAWTLVLPLTRTHTHTHMASHTWVLQFSYHSSKKTRNNEFSYEHFKTLWHRIAFTIIRSFSCAWVAKSHRPQIYVHYHHLVITFFIIIFPYRFTAH